MRVLLVITFLLVGCATQGKDLAACQMSIEQQNDALTGEVQRRFGRQPNGYNILVKAPRTSDARGRIVIEGRRIYSVVVPEPAVPPEGRRLTVVVDPCARKVVRAFEPV